MPRWLALRMVGVACCCAAALAPACRQQRAASSPAAAALPQGAKRLRGGDAQAWLADAGDPGDSGYCDAELALPLSAKPAWQLDYSAAEISPVTPTGMVQYDGTVIARADTSVIFAFAADTGKLLFKQDAYDHNGASHNEVFAGLMYTPGGLLTGIDDQGRYYTWQVQASGLKQLALGQSTGGVYAGFVTTDDALVGGDRNGRMREYALADYSQPRWESHLTRPPRDIIATDDGYLLASTFSGEVLCLGGDGQPRWTAAEASYLRQMIVGHGEDRVYELTMDAGLICRRLADGALLWRAPADQAGAAAWVASRQGEVRKLYPDPHALERLHGAFDLDVKLFCCTPQGPVVGFNNGLVDAYSRDGELRWQVRCGPALDGGVAFRNGLLLHTYWAPAGLELQAPQMLAWLLDPPDWPEIADPQRLAQLSELRRSSSHAAADQQRVRVVFGRMVVLDLRSGKVLQAVPEADPSNGALLPAGGQVITPQLNGNASDVLVGADGATAQAPRGGTSRIVAYHWLP
jgi:outer membrane protein assembly factor BamB